METVRFVVLFGMVGGDEWMETAKRKHNIDDGWGLIGRGL